MAPRCRISSRASLGSRLSGFAPAFPDTVMEMLDESIILFIAIVNNASPQKLATEAK